MDERVRRIAENEVLFREVNDLVVRLGRGRSERFAIGCECGDYDCRDRIPVTHELYKRTREDPTAFLLRPGHENPEVETVIEAEPAYVIVRKIGEGAAIAMAADHQSPANDARDNRSS